MYSGPIRIHDCDGFAVDSYGHGVAYAFSNGHTRETVWVDGDEASAFRDQLETVTDGRTFPRNRSPLTWLWDECGWGDASDASDLADPE